MILGLAFGTFGLLLLTVAVLVLTSLRKSRLQMRALEQEIERAADRLRSPEEKAAMARQREEIEAQKRVVHGLFDAGGW